MFQRSCLPLWAVLAAVFVWQSFWGTRRAVAQVATPPAEQAEVPSSEAASAEEAEVVASASEALYLRVTETDAGRPSALQTATVRYEGKPGTKYPGRIVDLVGVVHIGQDAYYRDLNTQLGTYDRVLYELVAPDGTRIKPEDLEKRRSLLASVQSGMKDLLNLEYQLEKIDYMANNFRHADMSPDEFTEDLNRRGDSVWKMVARMMGAGLVTQANTGGDVGMLMAMFSSERSKMLKQLMARQLVDMEVVTAGMDDANGDNTLIKGRNRKAFDVLEQVLDDGDRTVAVFYGAGHLPDMAERLKSDFEMVPTGTTWANAWDLTKN
ncbi:MAG: hypothetical protein AAGD07_20560 [Planctomycetota bacterium]